MVELLVTKGAEKNLKQCEMMTEDNDIKKANMTKESDRAVRSDRQGDWSKKWDNGRGKTVRVLTLSILQN